MATIDATVGGTSSNAYITEVEADEYWDENYYDNWTALASASKIKLIITATRLLDEWFNWAGTIADEDQALRWPRYGAVNCDGYQYDGDIIPQPIKDATAELAGRIISSDPSAEPDTKGFSKIKVDVIELEIDKYDRDKNSTIPDSVTKMMQCLGTVKARGAEMVIPLGRA